MTRSPFPNRTPPRVATTGLLRGSSRQYILCAMYSRFLQVLTHFQACLRRPGSAQCRSLRRRLAQPRHGCRPLLAHCRPLPHRIPVSTIRLTPPHLSNIDRAAIIDYFRPWRVPKFHSLCNWLLRAFTLTTAVGLYEFETNDVGITEALRRIWNA